jgi:nitrite reductase/ring-hydroxylating ferredoxin subunit
MKKLIDGLHRQEEQKGLISGSETLRCAVHHQAVFKITRGQNHAWQNKPTNVSVANFPNFLAKLG